MLFETLVRRWHRPHTAAGMEEWERMELFLNAQLLTDEERQQATRSKRANRGSRSGTAAESPKKDRITRALSAFLDWLERRDQEARENRVYTPGMGTIECYEEMWSAAFVFCLVIIVVLLAFSLHGAQWTGLELYRIYDRIAHKMRRPIYYDTEAKKRADKLVKQRSESRRIRHRTSILQPPAPSVLMTAWDRSRVHGAVKEKLVLGSMMALVEAVIDHDLKRDISGEIVGRNPGVRGWLKANCPELLPHYKSLMHYKAMADKEQLICGLSDPYPAEVLFADPLPNATDGKSPPSEPSEPIEITVGPEWCWVQKGRRPTREKAIEITVGTIFDNGKLNSENENSETNETGTIPWTERMVRGIRFRGIRNGIASERMTEAAHRMMHARQRAAILHQEASETSAWSSLKAYEDILFARLGLVREKRLHSPARRRSNNIRNASPTKA